MNRYRADGARTALRAERSGTDVTARGRTTRRSTSEDWTNARSVMEYVDDVDGAWRRDTDA